MLMRRRRPTLGEEFNKKLEESRDTLKKVEDTLRSQITQTSREADTTSRGRGEYGSTIETPEPIEREDNRSMKRSNLPPEVHKDLDSEHDYNTPYGVSDRHHYHAACIDCDGKLVFLSDSSKEGLTSKINSDDTLDDVIAVYEGKLIYFEERRIINIR